MNLAVIAERIGLSPRRLRYVMEHGVLPGLRQKPGGFGKELDLTRNEVFGLAIAGILLEVGLRREVVATGLRAFLGQEGSDGLYREIFYLAFDGNQATLTLAEGRFIRLVARGGQANLGWYHDTGWLTIGLDPAEELDPHATPVAKVEVDLVAIRRRLSSERW